MKQSLIIIILFFYVFSFGQLPKRPYEKIIFNNKSPVWYETCFDSSLVNEESDGYNIFSLGTITIEPIIEEEYMISLHGKFDLEYGGDDGALIQKRNIKNGEVIWSIVYGYINSGIQEIPFKMYKDEEGFLHVLGYRRKKNAKLDTFPPFLWFPTDSCLLTYRKIDIETGKVLELLSPDDNDPDAFYLLASIDRARQYGHIMTTKKPDEFIFWQRIITDDLDVATVRFRRLNKFGKATSKLDSIRLNTPTNGYINFLQLSADTFVHVSFNRVDQKITLYYYNDQFYLFDSLELNSIPGNFRIHTHASIIKNKYLLIQTVDLAIDHYRFFDAVFDFKGNLVDYYDQRSYEFLSYWSSFDHIRKKILVMISRLNFNPLQYVCSLNETNGIGGLKEICRFEPSDTLRTSNGLLIFTIDKENTMIYFNESNMYFDQFNKVQFDNSARAKSYIVFNASDIGLNPVSVEASLGRINVKVQPNPTQDELMIAFDEDINGVFYIVDNLGNVLVQRQIQSERKILLQLDYLQPGMYYLKMEDQLKGVHTKRFIKH